MFCGAKLRPQQFRIFCNKHAPSIDSHRVNRHTPLSTTAFGWNVNLGRRYAPRKAISYLEGEGERERERESEIYKETFARVSAKVLP
jgi:hypothetical protein